MFQLQTIFQFTGINMAYKRVKKYLETIDELTGYCGLFVPGSPNNGGYGCKSKSKRKQLRGCCYSFDCPLATEADLEDLKELNPILYDQYKDDDGDIECGGWVVVHSEITKLNLTR